MTSALKVEGSKKYPNLRTNSIQGVRKSTFFAVFKRNWIFCFGRIRIFGHQNYPNIRTNMNIRTTFGVWPNIQFLAEYSVFWPNTIFGKIPNIRPNYRKFGQKPNIRKSPNYGPVWQHLFQPNIRPNYSDEY